MQIRWTTPAATDFTHLCDYIQERDGAAAARRVALHIYDAIDALRQFPARGRPGRVTNTRELVISGLRYIAIYRMRDSSVEIARILHGAQKWP